MSQAWGQRWKSHMMWVSGMVRRPHKIPNLLVQEIYKRKMWNGSVPRDHQQIPNALVQEIYKKKDESGMGSKVEITHDVGQWNGSETAQDTKPSRTRDL